MDKCKACGRDFASTDLTEEICYPCKQALKRLNGYAVPVVRCKDCIHRQYVDFGDEIGAIGGCGLFGTPMMTCNDFCSYGERRSDERKAD